MSVRYLNTVLTRSSAGDLTGHTGLPHNTTRRGGLS